MVALAVKVDLVLAEVVGAFATQETRTNLDQSSIAKTWMAVPLPRFEAEHPLQLRPHLLDFRKRMPLAVPLQSLSRSTQHLSAFLLHPFSCSSSNERLAGLAFPRRQAPSPS